MQRLPITSTSNSPGIAPVSLHGQAMEARGALLQQAVSGVAGGGLRRRGDAEQAVQL